MNKGDLVTVVLAHLHAFPHDGPLVRTAVHSGGRTRFIANDDDRGHHYLSDEGITWVHGHVADDSPEGKALIAAHALAPKIDVFADIGIPMTSSVWSPPVGSNSHGGPVSTPNPKNELGE